jgi:hypothetical protein
MLSGLCEYNMIKFVWSVTIENIKPEDGLRIVSSAVNRDLDGLIVHAIAVHNEENTVWTFGVDICESSVILKTNLHVGIEVNIQDIETISAYQIVIPPFSSGEFLSEFSLPVNKTSIFGTISYTLMYVASHHDDPFKRVIPSSPFSLPRGYVCKGITSAMNNVLQIELPTVTDVVNKQLMMENSEYIRVLVQDPRQDAGTGIKLDVRESVFSLAIEWLETLFFTPQMCKYRQELFIFADRYGFHSLAIKCIEKINSIPLEKGCDINSWISLAGKHAWLGVIEKVKEAVMRNEVDFEKISFEAVATCPQFFSDFCSIVKKKLKARCVHPCNTFWGSIVYE